MSVCGGHGARIFSCFSSIQPVSGFRLSLQLENHDTMTKDFEGSHTVNCCLLKAVTSPNHGYVVFVCWC